MKRLRLARLLPTLAILVLANSSQALTLPVTGGPGLEGGAVCDADDVCPGVPLASLLGPAAVVGSFVYDDGTQTVDVTLTLIQDAVFSDEVQLTLAYVAGTTFVASDVPVTPSAVGGGGFEIVQAGPATGSASPFFLSVGVGGSFISATTPAVHDLRCAIFPSGGHCSVSFGPDGLAYTLSGEEAHSFVSFSVAVPEPGTLWLLAAGIAGLARAARASTDDRP